MSAPRPSVSILIPNPDMDAVLDRYGGTEVCWAYDDDRRRAGEEILARY
jgi:hypothetical protein